MRREIDRGAHDPSSSSASHRISGYPEYRIARRCRNGVEVSWVMAWKSGPWKGVCRCVVSSDLVQDEMAEAEHRLWTRRDGN